MPLLEKIKDAGIVGCGGAGFPTHVKLNCTVEYLIINAAECEPLLRTDRWLMIHKAAEIITAVEMMAKLVQASRIHIALKETYRQEIQALESVIRNKSSLVRLFKMKNFYPAGDEQIMVCDVTGRTVPPLGIPLDVGAVVSNLATTYSIYQASKGEPFTSKYLTVTGAVTSPCIIHAPLGSSFAECLKAAGGFNTSDHRIAAGGYKTTDNRNADDGYKTTDNRMAADGYKTTGNHMIASDYKTSSCHVIVGGPLMGKCYSMEEAERLVVTKTTSGFILVPDDTPLVMNHQTPLRVLLKQAKMSCIQCSYCTQMCPRYLTGHPLKPHMIMRKLAYAQSPEDILDDIHVKEAMICSECGLCEAYACPMGLKPRQVNIYLKGLLRQKKFRYEKSSGAFLQREERCYRRVPSKRIAARLGVNAYYDYHIEDCLELVPKTVRIPLLQHIGAPCVLNVAVGDKVEAGQLIGSIPEQALGANIHASISGRVTEVSQSEVIICAE